MGKAVSFTKRVHGRTLGWRKRRRKAMSFLKGTSSRETKEKSFNTSKSRDRSKEDHWRRWRGRRAWRTKIWTSSRAVWILDSGSATKRFRSSATPCQPSSSAIPWARGSWKTRIGRRNLPRPPQRVAQALCRAQSRIGRYLALVTIQMKSKHGWNFGRKQWHVPLNYADNMK